MPDSLLAADYGRFVGWIRIGPTDDDPVLTSWQPVCRAMSHDGAAAMLEVLRCDDDDPAIEACVLPAGLLPIEPPPAADDGNFTAFVSA